MENQAVGINVLANDTDANGTINPASVAIKTAPAYAGLGVETAAMSEVKQQSAQEIE
jgi:hypothetical protein